MPNHYQVRRSSEPGRGVEKEFKAPSLGELADSTDEMSVGGNSEMISPPGSVGRAEPVIERHRQDSRRKAGRGSLEIALQTGVGTEGRGKASIEVTVVRVASDVTGTAERAYQRGVPMNPVGYAKEVVVGEVADDDVTIRGQPGNRLEIRSKMRRPAFLEKAGHGPRVRFETSFEVAAADEEHTGVDPGSPERTTAELGHGSSAGPLVGENDHAHPHQ